MKDTIEQFVQSCACGHDRAEHYRDDKGEGDCLGTRCDCAEYVHRDVSKTYRKQAVALTAPSNIYIYPAPR